MKIEIEEDEHDGGTTMNIAMNNDDIYEQGDCNNDGHGEIYELSFQFYLLYQIYEVINFLKFIFYLVMTWHSH